MATMGASLPAEYFLENVQKLLSNEIRKALRITEQEKVVVVKRNKRLPLGDFLYVSPKKEKPRSANTTEGHNFEATISAPTRIHECLLNHTFAALPVRVVSCNLGPDGNVYISIERTKTFKPVLKAVSNQGQGYGCNTTFHGCSLVNLVLEEDFPTTSLSLTHLRTVVLSQHVAALLKANGYDICYRRYGFSFPEVLQPVLKEIKNYSSSVIPSSTHLLLKERLKVSDYRYTELSSSSSADEKRNQSTCVLLNLQKYLAECGEPVGKTGYSSNLDTADFSESSALFSQVCWLEHSVQEAKDVVLCVHIIPQEKSFRLQQIDLGWRIASSSATHPKQVHLTHGPAIPQCTGSAGHATTEDLIRIRSSQLKEAFTIKYGPKVQGSEWEETVTAVTVTSIKIELLSVMATHSVKVDQRENSEDGRPVDSKGGVFILYNCARLAMLFHNFDQAVQDGIYPEMPGLDDIHFSTLGDEEWELLFNYVMVYPRIVQDCVASLSHCQPKSPIHTHKVCQFLHDLSRGLSSYYSRIHVLGEAQQHLMAVMFARLSVLKAVQQVLHNALALLDLEPISQL